MDRKVIALFEADDLQPLERMLLFDVDAAIKYYYAMSISTGNIRATSLLRNYIREHKIIINRNHVLEQLFYLDCAEIYSREKKNGSLVSFCEWDDKLRQEYEDKYWFLLKGFKR